MANYSQWHTERAPTSKKFNSIEEINFLSEKVDALMKLVSNKSVPIIIIRRITLEITLIIRGATRKRPRIKITSRTILIKKNSPNKIHIYGITILLNQSRQKHIIKINRSTFISNQFHKSINFILSQDCATCSCSSCLKFMIWVLREIIFMGGKYLLIKASLHLFQESILLRGKEQNQFFARYRKENGNNFHFTTSLFTSFLFCISHNSTNVLDGMRHPH